MSDVGLVSGGGGSKVRGNRRGESHDIMNIIEDMNIIESMKRHFYESTYL